MLDTIGLLQNVASDYGATLVRSSGGGQAEITIVRPGGAAYSFKLAVSISAERVRVRELPGHASFPAFCPDRHINGDGSFCLGWGEDEPSQITDEIAAKRWWAMVYQFISRQLGANNRGVFPGIEHGRAHGDAAKHQANAERAASRMGLAFARQASAGSFTIRKDDRPGKHRLELSLGSNRIARVSLKSKALVSRHTRCPCGDDPALNISECSDHADALATYILEQYNCEIADKVFLDQLAASGSACCGTLQTCGLRQAIERKQAARENKEHRPARHSKFWRPPARSKRPKLPR
jgi:hypothetical protein